jgi:N utilization substance protein B
MQVFYGHLIDPSTDVPTLLSQLEKNIERSKDLYLVYLKYLSEVCFYVEEYAQQRASKHLPTEADLQVSTRLASNPFAVFISQSESFNKRFKKRKLKGFIDEQVVRKLFLDLVERKKYEEYLESKPTDLKAELDIAAYIGKRILVKNDDLQSHLDESFINLTDDNQYLSFVLKKVAHSYKPGMEEEFFNNLDVEDDDWDFAQRLIKETLGNEKEILSYIRPRLKNWEADRIAMIDMALLRLAVAELMFFPGIPVKVTINEYIEISKAYSTPKSREFVNGVLDNLLKTLKADGKINKSGRGLLDL